jgi:hypothetical protein
MGRNSGSWESYILVYTVELLLKTAVIDANSKDKDIKTPPAILTAGFCYYS